jgi:hypothetical protein
MGSSYTCVPEMVVALGDATALETLHVGVSVTSSARGPARSESSHAAYDPRSYVTLERLQPIGRVRTHGRYVAEGTVCATKDPLVGRTVAGRRGIRFG